MTHNKAVSATQQKDIPVSQRFLARARQKRAKNEPFDHWVRAAKILWRIEHDLPVGNYRRRRKPKSGAGKAVAA